MSSEVSTDIRKTLLDCAIQSIYYVALGSELAKKRAEETDVSPDLAKREIAVIAVELVKELERLR